MKVQMQGQALRIRISEVELARLRDGETVENLTRLPGDLSRHQVRMIEGGEPTLAPAPGGWAFGLPRGELDPYVARLPCRDGLAMRLPVDGGGRVGSGVRGRRPRQHPQPRHGQARHAIPSGT